MKKILFTFPILLKSLLLFAEAYDPLYAGTLLAYYPRNTDPGHLSFQPFLFATKRYGFYNASWHCRSKKNINKIELLVSLETGITEKLDVNLTLDTLYSQMGSQHSFLYGDTQLLLGWQFLKNQKGTWIPDFRAVLGEVFPTGKYDHLNPKKNFSDVSGAGAYETFLVLIGRKIFYVFPSHPFNFNLNFIYGIFTKTHVHGQSAYRVSPNTTGKVHPGDECIVNLAFEYSLNRRWVLGTDIHYEHQNRCKFFQGKRHATPVGLPSSELFSLAPCLEYNFSENFSVESGVWFTVAGRNDISFVSGVFDIYWCF